MEEQPIKNLNFKTLEYADKELLYTRVFSLGTFNKATTVNEKLILISLIAFAYLQIKKTNPSVTVLKLLMQITKTKKNDSDFYNMLEALSIIVEDFCYNTDKADSCGLSSSKEIINKIKELLDSWLPF